MLPYSSIKEDVVSYISDDQEIFLNANRFQKHVSKSQIGTATPTALNSNEFLYLTLNDTKRGLFQVAA